MEKKKPMVQPGLERFGAMTAFHPQKFISAKQGLGYVQSRTCVTSVCCKCHFHDIAGRCCFQLAGELLVGLGWYEPPGLICWHVGRQQTKKRILNNMINRWSSFASYRVSDVNMQDFAQTAQMVCKNTSRWIPSAYLHGP